MNKLKGEEEQEEEEKNKNDVEEEDEEGVEDDEEEGDEDDEDEGDEDEGDEYDGETETNPERFELVRKQSEFINTKTHYFFENIFQKNVLRISPLRKVLFGFHLN